MTLPHEPFNIRFVEPPGILNMAPIDRITKGGNSTSVYKPGRQKQCAIDARHLLALAQIGDRVVSRRSRHAKSHVLAGAVEAENEAGFFRRAAMDMRIDAEGAMIAAHCCDLMFDKAEARPPHQRAIAKAPEIRGGILCLHHSARDSKSGSSTDQHRHQSEKSALHHRIFFRFNLKGGPLLGRPIFSRKDRDKNFGQFASVPSAADRL